MIYFEQLMYFIILRSFKKNKNNFNNFSKSNKNTKLSNYF